MLHRTQRLRVAAAVLAGLGLVAGMGCSADRDASAEADGGPREVSQAEALALGAAGSPGGALFLDVRSVGEFGAGHVPGALNIPHTELEARLAELAEHRGDELVVYCERGGRAAVAAGILRQNGFGRIGHLTGDMSGWRKAGLPIER